MLFTPMKIENNELKLQTRQRFIIFIVPTTIELLNLGSELVYSLLSLLHQIPFCMLPPRQQTRLCLGSELAYSIPNISIHSSTIWYN